LDGSPTKALGFRAPENQIIRFETFSRWGDMSGLTVMDLGCGYGDLKGFLDQHYVSVATYPMTLRFLCISES
jgi:2-polyprenyl-3-methyl-5-hydroxy-6-metoxy-1,4-benzoquinol methylase